MHLLGLSVLTIGLFSNILIADDRPPNRYDPLEKLSTDKVDILDISVLDNTRQRAIPIRVYRCGELKSAPVVLFSHSLGDSREGGVFLDEHWAARGYVAVFLQHLGSDPAVWQGKRPLQIMAAMREAASDENFILRAKVVPPVLDRWNAGTLELWSGGTNCSGPSIRNESECRATRLEPSRLKRSVAREWSARRTLRLSPDSPNPVDPRGPQIAVASEARRRNGALMARGYSRGANVDAPDLESPATLQTTSRAPGSATERLSLERTSEQSRSPDEPQRSPHQ